MIKLHSYQEQCVKNVIACSSPRQLISMPTGTGKTITFLAISRNLPGNTLILVHRKELLEQTYEKALKMGYKKEQISLIRANSHDPIRKLNLAMVQSIGKNLSKYPSEIIDSIIVDEAHHALAPSYIKIFLHFKIEEKEKILLGFTATPLRGDGKSLGRIFQSHSFKMTLQEATQQGYICPVHGLRIEVNYNIEDIENKGGDYDIKSLDRIINCEVLNELISEKCSSLMRLPAIVFCATVDHATKIKEKLIERGKNAEVISYKNSNSESTEIIRKLKGGEIDIILNAVKLSEGFDHPPIQTIVLARPTRSPSLYKQMIGRGLRLFPNKYDCLVMEFGCNDPHMISWDEIDCDSTFHSFTEETRVKREDAIHQYRSKFGLRNVKVLDVRVSPFSFYECKIQRMVKFRKDYIFIPIDDGFLLGVIRGVHVKEGRDKKAHGRQMILHMLFWKEKYKSFTCFSKGELYRSSICWTQSELEEQLKYFADKGIRGIDYNDPLSRDRWCPSTQNSLSMGKWYPSEEEPMSPWQKSLLPGIKTNARKAEMMIEDIYIKKAIDKFWRNSPFPNLEEDDNGATCCSPVFVI